MDELDEGEREVAEFAKVAGRGIDAEERPGLVFAAEFRGAVELSIRARHQSRWSETFKMMKLVQHIDAPVFRQAINRAAMIRLTHQFVQPPVENAIAALDECAVADEAARDGVEFIVGERRAGARDEGDERQGEAKEAAQGVREHRRCG